MYVLVFWDLDDQMRLPHMSFWPWLLLSLLYFSYKVPIISSSPTGIGLWGVSGRLMLIVAAPVDLLLGVDTNWSYPSKSY